MNAILQLFLTTRHDPGQGLPADVALNAEPNLATDTSALDGKFWATIEDFALFLHLTKDPLNAQGQQLKPLLGEWNQGESFFGFDIDHAAHLLSHAMASSLDLMLTI